MAQGLARIPALDGVRGVAVLTVFASHAGIPGFSVGGAGVDAFFVLSGFLISSILIGEIDTTGTVSLPKFYLRRIKRLTPALIILVVLYAILAPLLQSERSVAEHLGHSALSLFYLMDYARAFWIHHNGLVHTWSLAVEEHFYLVWPFALLAMCRWVPARHWLKVLAVAYLAATLWRCLSVDIFGWPATYFRFDSRLSALILGSLLAVIFRVQVSPRERQVWAITLIVGACLIATLAIWSYGGRESTGKWATLGIAMAEAVSLAVILSVVERYNEGKETLLTRLLSGAAIVYVGRVSYGLYLFHHPLTYWLYGYHWTIVLLISLPLALGLAALSYHFVERPILDGQFFRRLAGAVPPTLPPEPARSGAGR